DALDWLDAAGRRALEVWLDPHAPPSPAALRSLRTRIRSRLPMHAEEAGGSLTELGLALWRQASAVGPWDDAAAQDALRALERSLGLLGAEAARHALGLSGPLAEPALPAPRFEGSALRAFLDRDHLDVRDRALAALLAPPLRIPAGLPTAEYRERVLEAVRFLAREGLGSLGYPEAYVGSDDPAAGVAVFET